MPVLYGYGSCIVFLFGRIVCIPKFCIDRLEVDSSDITHLIKVNITGQIGCKMPLNENLMAIWTI